MKKIAMLVTVVSLLSLAVPASAVVGQGYPEQCVDTQTNPLVAYWEVCIDLNTDDDRGRIKAKATNSYMKVWDDVLQRWVRLRGTLAGGMAVTIMGPLGSRPHAESVSIAPPTNARFMVSDDVNTNTLANPMYFQISQDGTNAMSATKPLPVSKDMAANLVTNPLWCQMSQDGATAVGAANPIPISQDMGSNTLANPIYTQLSQDGTNAVDATHPLPISDDLAANAVANPLWFQISQDGTNAVDATHPIPISDDLAANAVANPLWFQISQDGTNAMDATHPISISKNLTLNSLANPLYNQISQDGTNAVDATHPIPISQDMGSNTLANPIYTQLSQDGTNAVDATHPLPISDDLAANAVANPLWFQISQDGTNAMDATHPISISKNLTVNSVTNPVWNQLSQDGSTAVGAANPLPISATMAANTLANTIKVELSDGTNAFFDNTTYPGYARVQDGDSTVVQDVLDTAADGASTTLNSAWVSAISMFFNGASFDFARNSATKALMVNVENHPAAFDEALGLVHTKKDDTAIYEPAKESTAGFTVATNIMASRKVLNDVNFCVYIKNTGANPLTDADIQVSPDNVLWISLTWTACDSLAAGAGCVYCVTGNAYNYIRLYATAGVATTTDTFYTTNKG